MCRWQGWNQQSPSLCLPIHDAMANSIVPVLGLLVPACKRLCILQSHPPELLQYPKLSPRLNSSPLLAVFFCSTYTVGIFPCHTERTYVHVPKLGSKLFVPWWSKHLPTYVASVRGKENGWIGFSQPSYCCAEGQSVIRMALDQHGSESPYGAPPLLKQGLPIEDQFWAQVGVPGYLPCPAGGTIPV